MSTLSVETLQGSSTNGKQIVVPTGHTIYAPGHYIQIKTTKTEAARQVFTTTTPQLISGLSIDFTPKSASSLILVEAVVAGSFTHVNSCGIFKNGSTTVSTTGYTNRNEPDMQMTTYYGQSTTGWMMNFPLMHYEIAGSTTQRTYAVYTTSGWDGGSYTTYVNNRVDNDMASISYMTVKEIAQ